MKSSCYARIALVIALSLLGGVFSGCATLAEIASVKAQEVWDRNKDALAERARELAADAADRATAYAKERAAELAAELGDRVKAEGRAAVEVARAHAEGQLARVVERLDGWRNEQLKAIDGKAPGEREWWEEHLATLLGGGGLGAALLMLRGHLREKHDELLLSKPPPGTLVLPADRLPAALATSAAIAPAPRSGPQPEAS